MRWSPLLLSLLWAQDTIRVLAYNLLNYGQTPGHCLTDCKDRQLRTIIGFIQPDLIVFNEIAPYPQYIRRLLDSVLNIGGVSYWRSGIFPSNLTGDRLSMVYYDSRRFAYEKQELITTQGGLRDVYAFHLYYREPDLATHQDTLFVVVIASHLKAGPNASDANTRAQAALAIRNYIQALPSNRQRWVLDMGDHNLYRASEAAYQRLTEVLIDPGPAGEWDRNSTYAYYHTQSTRLSSLADGGSGGGLNSRFDFIFFSPACTLSTAKARYLPGSHKVIAQDGLHFGKSLLDPPQVAGYSQAVLNALYMVSDHLPVVAEFALNVTSALTALPLAVERPNFQVRVEPGYLEVTADVSGRVVVYDLWGRQVGAEHLSPGASFSLTLPAGVYLLQGLPEKGSQPTLWQQKVLVP